MKVRGKRTALAFAALGLLWVGRSYWLGKARSELIAFDESVKVGEAARAARQQCDARSLLSCGGAYEDDVVAATPLEFGATNWVAWVVVREGKVIGVRFRTEDSLDFKPPGSPADRGEAPRADDRRRQRPLD